MTEDFPEFLIDRVEAPVDDDEALVDSGEPAPQKLDELLVAEKGLPPSLPASTIPTQEA